MTPRYRLTLMVALCFITSGARAATVLKHYYAHDAVHDRHGVIAPWYTGLNGQCDNRVRLAAETMKRFPWFDSASIPGLPTAPGWVYQGVWKIDSAGVIAQTPGGWDGDVAQRSASMLFGFTHYYQYTGDASAKAMVAILADRLIDTFLTKDEVPGWTGLVKSGCCYTMPFDRTSHPIIQLDLSAQIGTGILKAYQMCGEERWFDAAKRWGDLYAANCNFSKGAAPWARYANPQAVVWNDRQTGGVAFVCEFLDELIRLGYTGNNEAVVKARDAGRAYLREVVLPKWTLDETWGRYYWDWEDPVTAICPPAATCRYMMAHKDAFPNWKKDVRNILSLYMNRTCTTEMSMGDVYSGSWQYPESTGCCGKSLQYPTYEIAAVFAQYGQEADSNWAREIARRSILLVTYDAHETGVVEDAIDGGQIVAGDWLNLSHPWPIRFLLQAMSFQPETLAANRENHILRSSAVVREVSYGVGKVACLTGDAPVGATLTMRLSFQPASVTADGVALPKSEGLDRNGYRVRTLPNRDAIVTIRHDRARRIVVTGSDSRKQADASGFRLSGDWQAVDGAMATSSADASAEFAFEGNQVRVIGSFGPSGGIADVYIDGVKQLVYIDAWNRGPSEGQTLYYRSGLANTKHTLKIVARGKSNPLATGSRISLKGVQWSDCEGDAGFGEGNGPTYTQRMVFGYANRDGYRDSAGDLWMPATEYVVRIPEELPDVVTKTWWTRPRRYTAAGTADPELYLYGVHAPQFTVNLTVGPGAYYLRLKFMGENRDPAYSAADRSMTILINGKEATRHFDPVATAGGWGRACDLVFNGIEPQNGIIEIKFVGSRISRVGNGEAFVNAIEVGPGDGGSGLTPVVADVPQVGEKLVNPSFETFLSGITGGAGVRTFSYGWHREILGPGYSYIWPESDYSGRPEWGGPEYHDGVQAIRTHANENGHVRLRQDVKAEPGKTYEASVWVRAADMRGKGFGTSSGDSAGLILQELDADGSVLAEHPKLAVTDAGPYRQLKKTVTVSARTGAVRFILDTVIGSHYSEGHVTYDDCGFVEVDAK